MTALDADVLASLFWHLIATLIAIVVLMPPGLVALISIETIVGHWTARREAAAQVEADQRRYGDDGGLR